MRKLSHLATRLYGAPLCILSRKLTDIHGAFQHAISSEAPKVDASAADEGLKRKPYEVTTDGIAVISILGPLVSRDTGDFLSGGPTTYRDIEYEFLDAATDPAIKGILIDIDSPGGEVSGLFDLADMIHAQRGSKPICAVANDCAYSAAYAIAAAADQIYVTRTGGVGSIGVVAMHCDQSGYDEQIGAKVTYIYAGDHKIDGNPHEPLSDSARATFQDEIDRIYGLFVNTVARNRHMSAEAVRATQAGLYYADEAVRAGLADKVGTLRDALANMADHIARPTMKTFGAIRSAAATVAPISHKEASMPEENTATEPEQSTAEPAAEPTEATNEQPAEPTEAQPVLNPAPAEEETLATAVASAREAGITHAQELMELCSIAGRNDLALKMIQDRVSVADARKQLLGALASAQEPIRSTILPGANAAAMQSLEASARETAKKEGITYEAAYTKLLKANPQAYEQYLEGKK